MLTIVLLTDMKVIYIFLKISPSFLLHRNSNFAGSQIHNIVSEKCRLCVKVLYHYTNSVTQQAGFYVHKLATANALLQTCLKKSQICYVEEHHRSTPTVIILLSKLLSWCHILEGTNKQ